MHLRINATFTKKVLKVITHYLPIFSTLRFVTFDIPKRIKLEPLMYQHIVQVIRSFQQKRSMRNEHARTCTLRI
jgi:hypothetical protein